MREMKSLSVESRNEQRRANAKPIAKCGCAFGLFSQLYGQNSIYASILRQKQSLHFRRCFAEVHFTILNSSADDSSELMKDSQDSVP